MCLGAFEAGRVDWLKTEVWFAGYYCLGAEISLLVPFCFLDFGIFTSSSRLKLTTFKTRGHWWDNIGILQNQQSRLLSSRFQELRPHTPTVS